MDKPISCLYMPLVVMVLLLLVTPVRQVDGQDAPDVVRKFADHGDANAQHQLGMMYAEGRGVTKDNVAAYMWMTLASQKDDVSALEEREHIASHMTLAEIVRARGLVQKWKPVQP